MATQRKMTIPTHGAMVERIVNAVTLCNPAELAAGIKWYGAAREYAATLATGTTYTTEQVCGVLAALSPQCPWNQNKEWARQIVAAKVAYAWAIPAVSTTNNRKKAWACLEQNANPAAVLGGPKVTAFYNNLIGDASAVTVDVWAFYVATGIKLTQNQSVPKWAYPLVVEAYKAAARELHITPAEAQAAAWVYIRGTGE